MSDTSEPAGEVLVPPPFVLSLEQHELMVAVVLAVAERDDGWFDDSISKLTAAIDATAPLLVARELVRLLAGRQLGRPIEPGGEDVGVVTYDLIDAWDDAGESLDIARGTLIYGCLLALLADDTSPDEATPTSTLIWCLATAAAAATTMDPGRDVFEPIDQTLAAADRAVAARIAASSEDLR